jgi:hypothetical protein
MVMAIASGMTTAAISVMRRLRRKSRMTPTETDRVAQAALRVADQTRLVPVHVRGGAAGEARREVSHARFDRVGHLDGVGAGERVEVQADGVPGVVGHRRRRGRDAERDPAERVEARRDAARVRDDDRPERARVEDARIDHQDVALGEGGRDTGRGDGVRVGDRAPDVGRREPVRGERRRAQIDVVFALGTADREHAREPRDAGELRHEVLGDQLADDRLREDRRCEGVREDGFAVGIDDGRAGRDAGRQRGAGGGDRLIDGLQVVADVALRIELDDQLGAALGRGRQRPHDRRQPAEGALERLGDREANALGRQIARLDDDVDARERHRREDRCRDGGVGERT